MEKRLYRSSTNKIIAGVCGGLGEYFEVDPVFIRIITVLLTLATGFGLLAYIVAWIIMPKKESITAASASVQAEEVQYSSWNKYVPGMILVAIGIILLIRDNWFWFDWEEFWPVILVVGGLLLIFRSGKKKHLEKSGAEINANNHPTPENGGTMS